MKTYVKIGLVSAAALMMSGCSLFTGGQSSRAEYNREVEMATHEAVAEINLEVGRENLHNGNLAAAARYLRMAQRHPSTRAQASNALGVVYVRLGRLDVAGRYFLDATQIDPDNARYLTNLARLEWDVSLAALRAEPSADDQPTLARAGSVPQVPVESDQSRRAVATARRPASGVIHIETNEGARRAPQIEVFERREIVQEVARTEDEDAGVDQQGAPSQAKVVWYPVRVEL